MSAEENKESDGCDSIHSSGYMEFKKYIHAEVISLKALMANQANTESGKSAKRSIDFETVFVPSLQDRVISLERQLDQKAKDYRKIIGGK